MGDIDTCPTDFYKSWTNLTLCSNLTKMPNATSDDDCRTLCCNSPGCGAWSWCPNNGCTDWQGVRCHLNFNSNVSEGCEPVTHWVGQSTAPLPPPPPPKPAAKRKRGFSGFLGDYATCEDATALGLGDSWYYSWLHTPFGNGPNHVKCEKQVKNGTLLASEFVPMIIGANIAEGMLADNGSSWVGDWEATNVHFLLGYNEPDFGHGQHPHQVAAAAAARDWVNVQKVAALFDPPLQLVGPAVSNSGPDAWDADGASLW